MGLPGHEGRRSVLRPRSFRDDQRRDGHRQEYRRAPAEAQQTGREGHPEERQDEDEMPRLGRRRTSQVSSEEGDDRRQHDRRREGACLPAQAQQADDGYGEHGEEHPVPAGCEIAGDPPEVPADRAR